MYTIKQSHVSNHYGREKTFCYYFPMTYKLKKNYENK